MLKAYITGSSVSSALGIDKQISVKKIETLNSENYDKFLSDTFTNKPFYSIQNNESKKIKFFTILEKVIFDALNDANISKDEYKNIHLYIGSTSMNVSLVEQDYKETQKLGLIGNGSIADYIEQLLGLRTTSIIFSSACTSSANALIEATRDIKQQNITKALVVGIELFNDSTYNGFNSLMLLSQSGKYKPFDKNSDGIVLGEGCSAIVLESKPKNKDDFYILGSENLFDSYSQTGANPNGDVIYQTMQNTLLNSNLTIEDLDLINTHAPGTEGSNEAELTGIKKFINDLKVKVTCMKPYIGHTLGACSTNEIVLLTQCIKNNFIPNTLGTQNSNELNFTTKEACTKGINILFTYNGFSGNNISILLSNKV